MVKLSGSNGYVNRVLETSEAQPNKHHKEEEGEGFFELVSLRPLSLDVTFHRNRRQPLFFVVDLVAGRTPLQKV